MEKIIPILKPAGYRKEEPFFLKKRLFENPGSPVIAFGKDVGPAIQFEQATSQEEMAVKLPKIEAEALQNLKSIPSDIDIREVEDTKYAFVSGDEYSSEKMLDIDFMAKLASQLGADSLMVGIPFKGILLATDANGPLREKFPNLIHNYYNDPKSDPISPNVFLVRDGETIAMGGEDVESSHDEHFSVAELSETNNYEVHFKSRTLDDMTDSLNKSFQQILLMIMDRKVFGGQINFHLDPAMKPTNEVVDKCNSYVEQMSDKELLQTVVTAIGASRLDVAFFITIHKLLHQLEKIKQSQQTPATQRRQIQTSVKKKNGGNSGSNKFT